MPRRHAPHDDVAVGDGAQVAAVLGIVHHGHDRDVFGAHQQRHLGARGASGGDVGFGNHHFTSEQETSRRGVQRQEHQARAASPRSPPSDSPPPPPPQTPPPPPPPPPRG